jgi:superfamily I DNA/RNA helicase
MFSTVSKVIVMAKLLRKISSGSKASHLSIRALAGTGKTTTICWGFSGTPKGVKLSEEQSPIIAAMQSEKPKTARFTAFSKAIATELSTRLPESVQSSTNHSLGKSTLYENLGRHKVSAWKTQNICEDLYGKVSDAKDKRATLNQYREIGDIVSISKACLAGSEDCLGTGEYHAEPEDLASVCSFYSVECSDTSLAKAIEVLKVSCERTDWIDFDDMIWLPAMHNLQPEIVDFGVIDEVQDTNKAQQWLATHSCRRLCTVGDINQSIFGFAGADPTSIPNLEEWMLSSPRKMQGFALTETRRCAKAIAREVQKIIPGFRAHPDNPEGIVDSIKDIKLCEQLLSEFRGGIESAVLCRTNAPLTRLALNLLKHKVPVIIKGRKFAEGIIRLIEKFEANSVSELLMHLEAYEQLESSKLLCSTHPEKDMKLEELSDKCIVVRIFCDGCSTVECVINKFNTLFSDENKKNVITLSSAHRSKGLEWYKVYIYRPELLPHPKLAAKSEFNRQQETNLTYVALTRAKFHLCYVTTTMKDVIE